MLAKDMLMFRKSLEEKGILFCYSGVVTEDVLSSIGNSLRSKLTLENADKNTARGLFAIFVEQVQNIIRYSDERTEGSIGEVKMELAHGLVTVGRKGDEYFVACGNLVEKRDVPRLLNDLNHVKSLDKEGLKALHKLTLKGDAPEHSKGAGVGFVDIARKATRGFEFDFEKLDEDHSFFVLKAFV